MVDLYQEINFDEDITKLAEEQKWSDSYKLKFNQLLKQAATVVKNEIPSEDLALLVKPYINRDYNNFVLVYGLPLSAQDKLKQLQQVIQMKFLTERLTSQLSVPIHPKSWGYYKDENNQDKFDGSLILQFKTSGFAQEAKTTLHAIELDKKHTIKAINLQDWDDILETKDQYEEIRQYPLQQLNEWQFDDRKREMYYTQSGKSLQFYLYHGIYKNPEAFSEPVEIIGDKIEFTKNGNYLIQYEKHGFWQYGGPKFEKMNFFRHKNLKRVEFSPNEKYALSFNGLVSEFNDPVNYIVWNVEAVVKLRKFKAEQHDIWGTFQWSNDSNYLAEIKQQNVRVFELPAMEMIIDHKNDRNPILVKNIQSFAWTCQQNNQKQNSNILICASYLGTLRESEQTGDKNVNQQQVATKITLFKIPTREELKWKTINLPVESIEFKCSDYGYWVVAIMKKLKQKKVISTLIQVANLKKKAGQGVLEISDEEIQDRIMDISFETKIGNFSVITELPQDNKTKEILEKDALATFYEIQFDQKSQNQTLVLKKNKVSLPTHKSNQILWAPQNGFFFVILNKDENSKFQGLLEFGFLTKKNTESKSENQQNQPEIIRSVNYTYMTDASYDPSGRYLITGSDKTNSYQIWDCLGNQLYKDTFGKQGLQSIQWRPKNTNLLTDEQEQKIKQDYKSYKTKYEQWDSNEVDSIENQKKAKRSKMKLEMEEFLKNQRKQWEETQPQRKQLQGYDYENTSDLTDDEIVESIETVKTERI